MSDSTITQWLTKLAESTISTEVDALMMQRILRALKYPSARVVSGIVYLDGVGTIQHPPMSINTVARMILQGVREYESKNKK